MIAEGFEPSPLRTSALSWRLRPLGQTTFWLSVYLPFEAIKGGLGLGPRQKASKVDRVKSVLIKKRSSFYN